MENYEELRIELSADEIIGMMSINLSLIKTGYKLNQCIPQGSKDIGTMGRITFILRKQEDKDATGN